MNTEIVKPHPNSIAAQASQQQMLIFEGWKNWRKEAWGKTNEGVNIYNPKLCGAAVEFEYAGFGMLYVGVMELAKFARWMQDNVPEYDEDQTMMFVRMNGNLYSALAGDDEQNCKDTIERVNNDAREAYEKTHNYAEQQEKSRIRQEEARVNMEQLVRELRPDFDYLDMGRWLIRFVEGQDRVGSGVDFEYMNSRFEQMGYIRNEGVFVPLVKPVGLTARIRYTVGQIMSFYNPEHPKLGMGGPCTCHPMLGEWAADAVREHLESTIEAGKPKHEQESSVNNRGIGSDTGGV